MDDIWGFAKDAAKVTLGAAKVTTNLITDSTLSTANLLKESVFLTKDIVGATASFTYNTATTGIYKTTDLLGLNNAAYELVKQYLINYLLNNPDEEKYKPLYKNLCYSCDLFFAVAHSYSFLNVQHSTVVTRDDGGAVCVCQ